MADAIRVDIAGALQGLQNYRQNAIPYAAAKTLTGLAYDSRDTLIREVPSRMRFRTGTAWLFRYFKVLQANAHNLTAFFFTTLDYMYLQEFTGIKYSHRAGGHLAVPLGDLRLRRIPDNMRPKFLLGQPGSANFNVPRKSAVARRRRYVSTFGKAFVMEHQGHTLIAMRTGPKQIKWLYVLVPSVRIGLNRLQMIDTTKRVVAQNFLPKFRLNLAELSARFSK